MVGVCCPRRLVTAFDGALCMPDLKDALWHRFRTVARARLRQSVELYNLVKRARWLRPSVTEPTRRPSPSGSPAHRRRSAANAARSSASSARPNTFDVSLPSQQARRQLPRHGQASLNAPVAARLSVYDLGEARLSAGPDKNGPLTAGAVFCKRRACAPGTLCMEYR
jgi:hypothetical protein